MSDDAVEKRRKRIETVQFDYDAQPKEAITRCSLCGSDTWTIISHRDRYGFGALTTSCERCSLTLLNPRMAEAAYAEFYRATYRPLVSAYHGRLIDAETVKEDQFAYAKQVVNLLHGSGMQSGRWSSLLDVGGSTGVVAAHLAREFALTPTVLDPAPEEVAEAEKLGVETIPGLIEQWDPAGRTFDVIGMFQTADHLLDVALAFEKIHEVISEDGLFILDIVDFRAAYLRSWSVEEATKIDHPFSLTQPTVEAFLHRAGFAVLLRSFAPDHLHVLYLCRKMQPETGVLPTAETVARHFYEIRYVQNAPRRSH